MTKSSLYNPLEWARYSKNYWDNLVGNFTLQFIVLLTSCYYGVKGVLYTFVMSGQLPYFQKYVGITGIEYQKYKLVSSLPWAMKAWIGLISDNYPIRGYNKRYYLYISTFVGAVSFAILGIVEINQATAFFAALLLFFASLDMATADLLCEGKYAEKMMEKPETSSDLVSWVWGVYQLGCLSASLFIGPISDNYSPKIIYLCAVPFALQFLVPLYNGYLPEEKVKPALEQATQVDIEKKEKLSVWIAMLPRKMREKPRVFVMAFLTALSALLLGVVHLVGTEGQQLAYSLGASVMLCVCSSWALPSVLSNANIYMFLCQVLYIQVNGAQDYFYTAGKECFDGPSFSFSYYTTYTVIVGSVAAWLGVVLFQAWMRDWNFRRVFWLTTFVRVIGSIFDICIAKRWNLNIGISDKTMYMFGDAVIYNIVYQMDFMPSVVLTSKVCPKGLESTIYALLAGMQNMGQNVSQSLGAYMITAMGVKTACKPSVDEECDCDFSNLPQLLFICHMFLPLLTIPLTFVLIPNIKMTDPIEVGGDYYELIKEDNRNDLQVELRGKDGL
ncbi:folate-biopterin transporter [Chloropicon primus]|nr:folate-biopterin transporter [Chloropicon primus]